MLVKTECGIYGLGKELKRLARKGGIPFHAQLNVLNDGLSILDRLQGDEEYIIFSHGYSVKFAAREEKDVISIVYSLDNSRDKVYSWACKHTKDFKLAWRFASMKTHI